MKNGPKKAFWEGKLMPTILRGSTSHNREVLEQRQRIQKLAASKAAISVKTEASSKSTTAPNVAVVADVISSSDEFKDLFDMARAIMNRVEAQSAAKIHFSSSVSKQTPSTTKSASSDLPPAPKSKLYCDEVLSPSWSPTKSVILSPFSKSKSRARALGVYLGEDCRGMYDQAELNKRIEQLGQLNAKLRSRQ